MNPDRRVGWRWATRVLATGLAMGVGTPSVMATTIDLSWSGCTPIVAHYDPAGNDPLGITVTAIGQAEIHRGYEFWIAVNGMSDELPDAWRFDAEGCQGLSRVWFWYLTPTGPRQCGQFQGAAPSLVIQSYQPAPAHLARPPGTFVAVLANVYPEGSNRISPNVRYLLGRIEFDHRISTAGDGVPGESCGGYEQTLCFQLVPGRTNWVNAAGAEVPFEWGQSWLTFRNPLECHGPVPASDATWGAIKAAYR